MSQPCQAAMWAWCYMAGCNETAQELGPGLPTLWCKAHRDKVLLEAKALR